MAVYDDEKQKNGTTLPSDDDLRALTGINEEQEAAHEREATSGAASDILGREQNPDGKSDKTGADEKASLAKSAVGGGGGGFSFRNEKGKGGGLRNRAKSLGKHKMLLGGVGGGSLLLLVLIMLLFLIGSQIIPNFAQNMIAYSFARIARETADSTSSVTAEKIALDTADDPAYANAENTFDNPSETDATTGDNLWKKLNNDYRPQKVVDNMRASGQIYYEYGPDKSLNPLKKLTGRQTLQKIYINGNEIDVPQNSFSTLDKILNPVDYAKGIWQTNRLIKTSLADSMNTTLRGTNWIIRSKAAGIIRDKFDIKLYRWDKQELNQLDEDSVQKADLENERESVNIETDNFAAMTEAEEGLTSGSKEQQAADQVSQDMQNCMGKDACVQQIIDSGGELPTSTISILNNIFASNVWDTILKLLGPTYAIAAPLCMIYEGSIVNSGGVINANEGEIQRTAYQVTSAADQQKYGNVNGNAIGAQERQMGNNGEVANSDVMKRASGIPVDTSQSGVDPQQAANGTYSYDILSFLGPVGTVIRPVIKTVCDVFDNPWTGLVVGILSLAIPAIRGALEAVGEAAGQGIAILVGKLATSLGTTLAEMFSKKELVKMVAVGGATLAGALLAKYIVLQHVAALNNGFSRNQSFDDRAEAGAIDNAQYTERQQNMGVPMSPSGTAQTKVQDMSFMNEQEQHKSVYQRFFAIDNASSFINKLGVQAWAHMNLNTIPDLVVSAGRMFNPISALSNVFGIMQNKSMAAASQTLDTTDYNEVQYGWTPIEEWHYLHDPNYSMLKNQQVLDQSGQEQTLSDTYMKCFTSKMGDLLSAGDLQRDNNGVVLTATGDGDCAPDNLSPTNRDDPIQTDKMVFANSTAELVYRWRVAIRNQNNLNQLLDTQNAAVTND